MKKYMVSNEYYHTKTRDRIGGTVKTNVFLQENGLYGAYSFYWQDEDEKIVGYAENFNDERAVMLSRKDLRREWKEEQERIAAGAIEEKDGITIYMASGEIVNL
jgi:hypothetical protein